MKEYRVRKGQIVVILTKPEARALLTNINWSHKEKKPKVLAEAEQAISDALMEDELR